MTHFDHTPAFRRLSAVMGWDQLDDNGPPAVTSPPRAMPPASRDAATIRRRRALLTALARIGRAA